MVHAANSATFKSELGQYSLHHNSCSTINLIVVSHFPTTLESVIVWFHTFPGAMLNSSYKFSEKPVMANAAKVPLIFVYGKAKQSNGNQEAQCTVCSAVIKGKTGITSNFVTHMKVKR